MHASGDLVGPYRLVSQLGKGAMGEVWEASDTRLDRTVAIKVLKPELCGDAEFLHRFAGDVPWAHLDIAGTAWESERPYAPEHGCGYGVRLLVELASRLGNGRSSRS